MDDARHFVDGAASEAFSLFMIKLAEAWGTEIGSARILWYARLLDGVPLPMLERVAGELAGELRFFPSAADFLDRLRPRPEDAALLAWLAFERAAASVGAWRSIEVADPAAAEALVQACGGWPQFCSLEEGPATALARSAFLAAYKAARLRTGQGGSPTTLSGLAAAQGRDTGECGRLAGSGVPVRLALLERLTEEG